MTYSATPKPKGKPILLALSGGVRSALSSTLLRSQGFNVSGVHVVYDPDELRAKAKQEKVEAIALKAGIPLEIVDLRELFENEIIDRLTHAAVAMQHFDAYRMFYEKIIFEGLERASKKLGIEALATGHSVNRIDDMTAKRARLFSSRENNQSFVLAGISQSLMSRTQFPLGALTSVVLQKLSNEYNLTWGDSPELADFPFFKTEQISKFVEPRIPPDYKIKGVVQASEGHTLGEHDGLYLYRVGMNCKDRLKIQVKKPEEYFVCGYDLPRHILIVGEAKTLLHSQFTLSPVQWLQPLSSLKSFNVHVLFEAGGVPIKAKAKAFVPDLVHLALETPVKAPQVGQNVVFVEGEEVIATGRIRSYGRPYEIRAQDLGL